MGYIEARTSVEQLTSQNRDLSSICVPYALECILPAGTYFPLNYYYQAIEYSGITIQEISKEFEDLNIFAFRRLPEEITDTWGYRRHIHNALDHYAVAGLFVPMLFDAIPHAVTVQGPRSWMRRYTIYDAAHEDGRYSVDASGIITRALTLPKESRYIAAVIKGLNWRNNMLEE